MGMLMAIALSSAAPSLVIKDVEDIEEVKEVVPILKQINQINDDGSYTFGYEAGDGSFRLETKDVEGQIKGKYGYVDQEGQVQVLEYLTGSSAGKSLGFQARGSLVPVPLIPVIRPKSSPEQRILDFQYSSVDEDEDGIPDAAPQVRSTIPVSAQVTVAAPGAARVAPVVAPVRVAQAPLRIAQAPVRVAQRQRVAPTPQLVQFTRRPVFQSAPLQFAPRRVFQTSPRQIEQFIQDVQFDSVDADQDGIPDQPVQSIFTGRRLG